MLDYPSPLPRLLPGLSHGAALRVRYCATDTCLAWLRAGEVSAFVSDQPLLDYIAQQQPCDLQVVGDPFGPGGGRRRGAGRWVLVCVFVVLGRWVCMWRTLQ